MQPQGPKIAEGRDSEIYDHGPGLVLRVAHDGRSLVHEARVMDHVRSQGFPCPAVHDAGDGYLVMDRLEGPTMLDAATKPPFPIRRFGRELAELHNRLHALPAPDWLPPAPSMEGDRFLHRDLHPLNVLVTPDGPVVIDWANAAAGDPAFDVADTWVLFATASPGDLKPLERVAVRLGRKLFLRAFLGGVDRDSARLAIPAAVEARARDRNMTPDEIERMRDLARWASNV